MPRWVYTPPYSLLDLLAAIAIVAMAHVVLPPVFVLIKPLHPENANFGWMEITAIIVVLLVLTVLISLGVEPLRKALKTYSK